MKEYKRDRINVDKALRESGIITVITEKNVTDSQSVIDTVLEVYKVGYLHQ